jgi:hypothetical protein
MKNRNHNNAQRKVPYILMDVTTQILIIIDCLSHKVAKPIAVVRLVIKVAIPTLVVTRCKALALLW